MKQSKAPADVEAYFARIPEPARTTLLKVRAAIRAAAPAGTTEAMGYGMPTFRYQGALVGIAAFPNHCGLYPMSPAVIVSLRDQLERYETSKGTIRFPVDRPLPAALVKKIVKARLAEKAAKLR